MPRGYPPSFSGLAVGWLYVDVGLGAAPEWGAGYVTAQNKAFNSLPSPQLRDLLLDPSPHKLLVLAGPCLEETGELLLQTGGFSSRHFLQVLGDKEVSRHLPGSESCLILIRLRGLANCCPPGPHPLPLCGMMVLTRVPPCMLSGPSPVIHYSVWFEAGAVDQQMSQRPQVAPQIPGPSWERARQVPYGAPLDWAGQMRKNSRRPGVHTVASEGDGREGDQW